jgi:hypothetical protein
MKVKAADGLLVPHEFNPRTYIDSTEVVEVPETPYYVRRLAAGELVDADAPPLAPTKTTNKGKGDAQ